MRYTSSLPRKLSGIRGKFAMFGIIPGSVYAWPKNVLHWKGIDRYSTTHARALRNCRSASESATATQCHARSRCLQKANDHQAHRRRGSAGDHHAPLRTTQYTPDLKPSGGRLG